MAQMSRGVLAGLALAAAAAMTAGSPAEAVDGTTITALDNAGEGAWSQPSTTVETGDTVTWSFAGTTTHNVASSSTSNLDPRWEGFAYKGEFTAVRDGSSTSFTFYKHGTYTYVCEFHPNAMRGEITVVGPDRDIPVAPPPTATPTPTPTPAPPGGGGTQPSPPPAGDHTETPAPSPGFDTTRPAISRVKLRALKHAARVSFRLSEPATVTASLRRGKRAVRSVRVQAAAGKQTVTVRRIRRGTYSLTLRARDALGNRSAAKRSALRIRR
jgi:plastocyanin